MQRLAPILSHTCWTCFPLDRLAFVVIPVADLRHRYFGSAGLAPILYTSTGTFTLAATTEPRCSSRLRKISTDQRGISYPPLCSLVDRFASFCHSTDSRRRYCLNRSSVVVTLAAHLQVSRGNSVLAFHLRPVSVSPPLLAAETFSCWLFVPVRPHIDPLATAPTALHPWNETRHRCVRPIVRYIQQRFMSASGIETGHQQPMHAEFAHIAEGHRWAGWLLGHHTLPR
jgi:hypothetical protein